MTSKGELTKFLGRLWTSAEVQEFVKDFAGDLEFSQVEDRLYYEFSKNGLSWATDTHMRIEAIYIYSEGRDEFEQFRGELPFGLTMMDGMEGVRAKMGEPTKSGEAEDIPMFGRSAAWDRYDFEKCSVHVEYDEEKQKISLITLMTPDAVPGDD